MFPGLKRISTLLCIGLVFSGSLSAAFWQEDATFTPALEGGGPEAMLWQPDGKIVISGLFDKVNGVVPVHTGSPSSLVRLNADGSTDTTFSAPTGGGEIFLQPDGKILVADRAIRLNADGSLDESFRFVDRFTRIRAVDAIGRIYGSNSDGMVVRYTASGERDASFEASVRLYATGGGAIAPLTDGSIMVPEVRSNSSSEYDLVRLLENGARDPAFRSSVNSRLQGLVPLPDGKVLAYGTISVQFGIAMQFVRLTATGAADYTYTVRYVAPDGTTATGLRSGDVFHLAGVLHDLLQDAAPLAGAPIHASASLNEGTGFFAPVNVGTDGLATIAIRTEYGFTMHRYSRAPGDLTIDPRPTMLRRLPTAPLRVAQGGLLSLSATAGGLAPLTYQWMKDGVAVPGAAQSSLRIFAFQPSDAGNYALVVTNPYGWTMTQSVTVSLDTDPVPLAFDTPLVDQTTSSGNTVALSVRASGNPRPTFTWTFNGASVDGLASRSLGGDSTASSTITLTNVQASHGGLYRVVATDGRTSVETSSILGVLPEGKLAGDTVEIGTDIQHPNGNIYDQISLQGGAATVTANPGQVTRISYVDLSDDIVQVEFAGAGSLSLTLDPNSLSGPVTPVNYNQPQVRYMKGHASIVIVGADETTNVSVFSVGRITAVNQALFREGVDYDGVADIASIAISSATGRFGGVRTGNARYFAIKGVTGIFAPNVRFDGPVILGDIIAVDGATPVLLLGRADDVRVSGGAIAPAPAGVAVSGVMRLDFVAGVTSHNEPLPAQNSVASFMQDGVDVTPLMVESP